VTLSFQFASGPQPLHTRSFIFTVAANENGDAVPSPVENVEGYIQNSNEETIEENDSTVELIFPFVLLTSNPESKITFNQILDLTATADESFEL
jgi:hypothetical protein